METASVIGWEDGDDGEAGVGGVGMSGVASELGMSAILLGEFLLVAVKLGSFGLLLLFLLLSAGISGAQR